MSVKVCQVRPSHGGFGAFDLGEVVEAEGCETLEDYLALVEQGGCYTRAEGDEAEDAHGRIHDQGSGAVIAWRDWDGHLVLECVYVEAGDEG